MVMKLCTCGNVIATARVSLGYSLCIACGTKAARDKKHDMQKDVALAYNKGTYMYLPRSSAVDTRDTRRSLFITEDAIPYYKRDKVRAVKKKRLGVYFLTPEDRATQNGVVFFSADDPALKRAHRVVWYGEGVVKT